jgi:hypothetical protein
LKKKCFIFIECYGKLAKLDDDEDSLKNKNDNNFVSEFRSSKRTVICSKIPKRPWANAIMQICSFTISSLIL